MIDEFKFIELAKSRAPRDENMETIPGKTI
jgi:hypothetical protein